MNVPFLDLKAQYKSIKTDIDAAIQEVLDSCAFAGGPFVEKFEKEWAAYCGAKHAIAVGNGTDALWLALLALGVDAGHEVITVPNTFLATAEAISLAGAKPVFVDIDPKTYTMDPALLERAITPRTRAIIPVHIFGQTADMDPILEIARKHSIAVIEDACQAHGAGYKKLSAGSIGDIGCFSFYPGKNLGAYGEAGAVITNNDEAAAKMRIFRDHGQSKKYYHSIVGWNARMDGIQGAVLSVKLKRLEEWNNARRTAAGRYLKILSGIEGIVTPTEAPYAKHVYHVFAVRVKGRDALLKALLDKGIHCGVHYPVAVHLQEAYSTLNHRRGSFPVTEVCADEYLSLPMYPELTLADIEYVSDVLKKCIQK